MPKVKNKTIAQCRCRVSGCDQIADVRRFKNHERGQQYLDCPTHGVDRTSGKFQIQLDSWIEENTIVPGTDPAPVPKISEPISEPEPKKEPVKTVVVLEPVPAPVIVRPGIFGEWWD